MSKNVFLVLLCVFFSVQYDVGTTSGITIERYLNLLNYARKSLTREPVTEHREHFNYTDHVELISNYIVKYFFNDVIQGVKDTDEGPRLNVYRNPVDFLILLDSSASIGSEHFNQTLQTLKIWINLLDEDDFTNDVVRVSMVSFSEPDKVIHHFPFSSSQNKSEVISNISDTNYHRGQSTSTALGLWFADSIFRKTSRDNVHRVLLLATDGWSNDLDLPFGVLWPAARLKQNLGVKVFVLGIGNQINHNELRAIASKPSKDYLYEVSSYAMMLDVIKKVKEKQLQVEFS